jgi:predicted O-methyltransferase YrrM
MGFVENNLQTHKWFNFSKFYEMVAKKEYTDFVEIGVWKGHSIVYLGGLLNEREVNIHAVDLWGETYKYTDGPLKQQKEHVLEIFRQNVKNANLKNKINEIQKISWEASGDFDDESVDFVFIDADHTYESVVKDINSWLPKVRKGGMISGHDYFNPCGVKQAVDEKFGDRVKTYDSCWYVEV